MNKAATFDLTLKRVIRAPRERVFDAFVKPEMMKAWMCPRGMSMPECEADARVGGRYRVTMRSRDREEFTAAGTYREVERPERLVYTWQWQGEAMPNIETLVSVSFRATPEGTEVVMHHSGFPDAAMCESHLGGWNGCLNRLADAQDERGTAASVTLFGDPRSPYVRTVRLGLAEKGLKVTLDPAMPHSPAVDAIHPWGRIPAFRDGDYELFESTAILRYVNEAFDGPALMPGNIRDRGRAEQWISAIHAYVAPLFLQRYVGQYVFAKDGKPDRSVIDPALKEIPVHLGILDRAYGERDCLAGTAPSIADFLLAPMAFYLEQMPEGKDLLAPHANLRRAQTALRARPSWKTVVE
jgi:glutathione S-transferase